MSDPQYIAQVEQPHSDHVDWMAVRSAEAENCTYFRCTVHPENPEICLLEGWNVEPEEKGEPRFFLTKKEEIQ